MIAVLRRPLFHLQVLFAVAFLLGGGGVVYGWRHMVIELSALLVLALNPLALRHFFVRSNAALAALVVASVSWPLLQAVPLPPAVWQALPGRELVVAAYAASGIATDSWFSFSLDPMRSLVAFCATLLPFAVIVAGASLDKRERIVLARTVALYAGAGLLLGAVQLTSANTAAILYDISARPNVFYALFSNQNTTGVFFVVVALLLVGLPWPRTPASLAAAAASVLLALLAVALTQSRSSIALAVLVVPFAALRLAIEVRQSRKTASGRPLLSIQTAIAGAIVLAFGLAGAASLVSQGRLAESASRFSVIERDRLEMWEDGAFVAGRYWPAGAGTGALDDVFQIDESLEYVSFAKAGRAHNDYIELAVELGLPGFVLLLAWWIWIGVAAWRRSVEPDRWLGWAGFASLVVIAAQSGIDYPLRNHAMLAMAGLMIVLLIPGRPQPEKGL